MKRGFEKAREAADGLLVEALEFKVLVRKRRVREEVFEVERELEKRQRLDVRDLEEGLVARRMEQASTRLGAELQGLDEMEGKHRLELMIRKSKEELFDLTVEDQQMELVREKLELTKTAKELMLNEPSVAGFNERDALVKQLLELGKEFEELEMQIAEMQREQRKLQTIARGHWETIKSAQKSPTKSKTSASSSSSFSKTNTSTKTKRERLVRQNKWLKSVLITMVLEAKVNWASEPNLRKLFLMDI